MYRHNVLSLYFLLQIANHPSSRATKLFRRYRGCARSGRAWLTTHTAACSAVTTASTCLTSLRVVHPPTTLARMYVRRIRARIHAPRRQQWERAQNLFHQTFHASITPSKSVSASSFMRLASMLGACESLTNTEIFSLQQTQPVRTSSPPNTSLPAIFLLSNAACSY